MLSDLRNNFFSKVHIKTSAKVGSNTKFLASSSVSLSCLLLNIKNASFAARLCKL